MDAFTSHGPDSLHRTLVHNIGKESPLGPSRPGDASTMTDVFDKTLMPYMDEWASVLSVWVPLPATKKEMEAVRKAQEKRSPDIADFAREQLAKNPEADPGDKSSGSGYCVRQKKAQS